MRPDYLWHLTLDTGHGRRSPRSEVDDGVVSLVGQQIAEALAGLTPEVMPGVQLKATSVGAALLVTANAGDGPLATFAVAAKSKVSPKLWEELRRMAPEEVGSQPPPQAPWCAVKLHSALLSPAHLGKAPMLGDLGRCVAWAWIEGMGRTGNDSPN